MSRRNGQPPSLPEEEWNFDSLPEDQILDCLYYELGRESITFRRKKAESIQFRIGEERLWIPPKSDLKFLPIRETTQFSRLLSFVDFCDHYQTVLDYFPEKPWLALPSELRAAFSSNVEHAHEMTVFPRAFTANSEMDEFVAFYYRQRAEKGFERVDCAINWSYSDEIIIQHFAEWLRKRSFKIRPKLGIFEQFVRPRVLANQKGRGFKQLKSSLDDLSVTRLLRGRTMEQAIKLAEDNKWTVPHKNRSTTRTWRARRKPRFKRILSQYLAGLPEGEIPLSAG